MTETKKDQTNDIININENNPLISVIVPVYNVENYLERCINSILAQTYSNIEIILVDDGSKDGSSEICDMYVAKHDRCHVIHKENEGLGLARNTGLEHISGEYVTFVDSDDWIEPQLIEQLVVTIIKHNVDFVKSGFKRVNNEGAVLFETEYDSIVCDRQSTREVVLARMLGSLPDRKDSISVNVWGCLYKEEIIRKYKIEFPSERILISEDLIFNIEYLLKASSSYVINSIGYAYVVNENSLSLKYREDRFDANIFLYQNIKQRIACDDICADALLRLQRNFFVATRCCIKQESKRISNNSARESIKRIEKICNNDVLRNIISNYPVKKMGFRQRVFIELIKKRKARILYLSANTSIL